MLSTVLLVLLASSSFSAAVNGAAIWETLPPTPQLPTPISSVLTPINGVRLWMQKYNQAAGGLPVVFDHGGLGYSAYFGDVIKQMIQKNYYVIAVDRRGHGRSTFNHDDVFTYDQFAIDVHAQLAAAGVTRYNVVGWSDGGITTLAALLNATMARSINKAVLFGTTMVPEDGNATFPGSAVYNEFIYRCASEYATLQPTADFTEFGTKVGTLEATLPQYTAAQLHKINGRKVAVVGADHDEAVNLDVPAKLHAAIPGSKLIMLSSVSHFAPMQDPTQFTNMVVDFLGA